jgi:hypothetical protein
MRLSRILLVLGALAVPAVPAAAQTKTTSTGVSKPASTRARAAKTTRTATPVKTAAVSRPEPVIELPVDGKIVLSTTLKTRLNSLLYGSTLTYDEAVTGWRNHGQLVAAMNAASSRNLPFPAIHHEVVTNRQFLVDAVAIVRGATAPSVAIQ